MLRRTHAVINTVKLLKKKLKYLERTFQDCMDISKLHGQHTLGRSGEASGGTFLNQQDEELEPILVDEWREQ